MKVSGELVRLVAYAYQATGRRRLLEEDFVKLLSHERRWLLPSKVRSLIQTAKIQGIVRAAGAHAYELGEGLQNVKLPLDYRPDAGGLDAAMTDSPAPGQQQSLFRRLVTTISEGTHESEAQIVAAVNQVQQESGGLLRAEVAALVVGRLREVEVAAFYDEVEASLQVAPHGHK